ncbi:Metal-pseudopaline receptor CntO [Alphaproteobacteria bacterium SO-S41]|nr:Metal-pseudopaline receptor CntO [Alphaproteobacteria bacterium SO-S41]
MRLTIKPNLLACVSVAAVLAAGVGTAAAQTPAPAAPAAEGEEEVIVTAQRVRENLQKVPLAVSAFNATRLKDNNIETLADLAMRVPGFSMTVVDPTQSNYAIRGIGSAHGISQNAGGDPSVVVFVDGVYAGRGGTPDIDGLNLERIEVLRGPQGTLFGKNAVGGLVQFITKKPENDKWVNLEATVGNYNRLSFKGSGNYALSDKTFVSASISSKSRDGYTLNETTGNDVDNEKLTTASFQFRFLPTDDLDIVLGFDITHQDQYGNPRDNICDPTFQAGIHCVGVNPDPRIVNAYIDGKLKRDLRTYRAEINWDTSIGTFTSITAFREGEIETVTPFFSNPISPTFPRAQIESTEIGIEDNQQFSQEVRLAFSAFDEKLTGQVGLYYLSEQNDRVQDLIQDFGTAAISGRARYPQSVDATSFAVFGQFNYAITDTLTATVGARMTWEEKSGRFGGFKLDAGPGRPPPLGAVDYDVTATQDWEAFTPRFALSWQAADNMLFYASASRGYKSGGFQGISGTAAGAATPYDPEYAWGYELGAKTSWWDDKLQLNLALFRTDYEDLQVSTLVPLCCVIVSNAATARIEGAELEFIVRPVEGLQIDGSYAYLDAVFTDYVVGATNNTGKIVPRSPKNKFNIGVQYAWDVGDWRAKARVDYAVQSKMYFDASNIANQTQEGYDNIDARLSFTAPDGDWSVALWGKNLTDELVRTYATNYPLNAQLLVPYAPPMTYGLTLTFSH